MYNKVTIHSNVECVPYVVIIVLHKTTTATVAMAVICRCLATIICHIMYARSNLTCMDTVHAITTKEHLP